MGTLAPGQKPGSTLPRGKNEAVNRTHVFIFEFDQFLKGESGLKSPPKTTPCSHPPPCLNFLAKSKISEIRTQATVNHLPDTMHHA